ncbi:MAG: DUF7684 family protein [Telluria sp.]
MKSPAPLRYLHLRPDGHIPAPEALPPFKAIVIAEEEVSPLWQWELCRWLVACGVRYALCHGVACEAWRAAIEDAADEAQEYDAVAPEQAVVTTAHEDEDLDEVFWLARHKVAHPALRQEMTLLLHVADAGRQDALEAQFCAA